MPEAEGFNPEDLPRVKPEKLAEDIFANMDINPDTVHQVVDELVARNQQIREQRESRAEGQEESQMSEEAEEMMAKSIQFYETVVGEHGQEEGEKQVMRTLEASGLDKSESKMLIQAIRTTLQMPNI